MESIVLFKVNLGVGALYQLIQLVTLSDASVHERFDDELSGFIS